MNSITQTVITSLDQPSLSRYKKKLQNDVLDKFTLISVIISLVRRLHSEVVETETRRRDTVRDLDVHVANKSLGTPRQTGVKVCDLRLWYLHCTTWNTVRVERWVESQRCSSILISNAEYNTICYMGMTQTQILSRLFTFLL